MKNIAEKLGQFLSILLILFMIITVSIFIKDFTHILLGDMKDIKVGIITIAVITSVVVNLILTLIVLTIANKKTSKVIKDVHLLCEEYTKEIRNITIDTLDKLKAR